MIAVILTLALVGLLLYLIERFIPMSEPFKTGIRIVAGVCVLFYLVSVFGLLDHDIPVPRLHGR